MFTLTRSTNAVRRTCIMSVAALTLAAALSLAGVLAEAQAATQSECISEFNDSDASSTCEMSAVTASGDNCTLTGLCSSSGSWHNTSITTNINNVDGLQNCSGSLATSC